MEKSKK